MPTSQTGPSSKVHLDTEINTAKTFLGLYRKLYQINDLSDNGLVLMLIGFRNYLGTLPSGSQLTFSGSLDSLMAQGFI